MHTIKTTTGKAGKEDNTPCTSASMHRPRHIVIARPASPEETQARPDGLVPLLSGVRAASKRHGQVKEPDQA